MKNIVLSLFLFLCAFSFSVTAQTTTNSTPVRWVSVLPATCNPAAKGTSLVYKSTAPAGLYRCSATNTWTAFGSGDIKSSQLSLLGLPYGANLGAVQLYRGTVTTITNVSTDLHTVATGKKARLTLSLHPPTGVNPTVYIELRRGATTYRLVSVASVANGAAQLAFPFIFQAGDVIAAVSNQASASTIHFAVEEFDASIGLKTLLTGSGTATTAAALYTVPAGKRAWVYGASGTQSPVNGTSGMLLWNSSGAARTFTGYVVPNGQSVSSVYQVRAVSVAASNNGQIDFMRYLTAGDAIYIMTDSALAAGVGMAFVTVYEESV